MVPPLILLNQRADYEGMWRCNGSMLESGKMLGLGEQVEDRAGLLLDDLEDFRAGGGENLQAD